MGANGYRGLGRVLVVRGLESRLGGCEYCLGI